MSNYLLRWKFNSTTAQNLVRNPQNRTDQAKNLIEGFGGKLESYFFALGEYDGCGIVQFPDIIGVTACAMKALSTGAFEKFETTTLLTGAEAEQAMRKAQNAEVRYQPPNG